MVNLPCLAHSTPQSVGGGVLSTLQDLSLLRLLQVLGDEMGISSQALLAASSQTTSSLISGHADGGPFNARIRVIILTIFTLVLAVAPALIKILREYRKMAKHRKLWLEIRCSNMEIGWLSVSRAPGFTGWSETQMKQFLFQSGLGPTLDNPYPNSGLDRSTNAMPEPHSSQRNPNESGSEKAKFEVDVTSVFTIW
jgi:calcium permeable stress-gated cation channel